MQAILIYRGKLKDSDEVVEQKVPINDQEILGNPVKLILTANRFLVELGMSGMVRRDGSKLTLIPGARFHEITVEIPSLIVASSADTNSIVGPEDA